MALRTALISAIASSNAARWGSSRKHLIMTLLEDRSCRLCAYHVEVLLRWRLGSNDAPFFDSLDAMQPLLLKAALAEDATSGGPVITASEPLTPSHNHVGSATPTHGEKSPAAAWGSCLIQLQVHQLAAQFGITSQHQQDFPYNLSSNTNLGSEGGLPIFLFDYESSTSQAGGNVSSSMPTSSTSTALEISVSSTVSDCQTDPHKSFSGSFPPVTPVTHRSSAPLGSNSHSHVLYSHSSVMPSTAEVPLEVATCWVGGAMSMTNSYSQSQSHGPQYYSCSDSGVGSIQQSPTGGSYGGLRSAAGSFMSVPADMSSGANDGDTHPKHTTSGVPVTSPPRGGLRGAMSACSVAPPPAAAQSLGSPSMNLHPLPPGCQPSLAYDTSGTPLGLCMSKPGGLALQSNMLSSDGMPGSLPASSHSGCYPTGARNWMPNSLLSAAVADTDQRGNRNTWHMSSLRQGPGGNPTMSQWSCALPLGGDPLSPCTSQSGQNMLMLGLSSSLGGMRNSTCNVHGNSSLVSPLCSPVCGMSGPGVKLMAPRDFSKSGCSVSNEVGVRESGSSGGGNMDLEAALEAIINFESGTPEKGSGLVSAATAAAAHNTLQHHVAAAVQAVAAGFHPPATSSSGVRANSNGDSVSSRPSNGSSGPCGMSFAAMAHVTSDGDGHSQGPGMGQVGSAPAMAAAATVTRGIATAMQQQQQQRLANCGLNTLLPAAAKQQIVSSPNSSGLEMSGLPVLPGGVGNAAPLGTPRLWTRLSPKLRSEVQQLLAHIPGVKADKLDDITLYQVISAKRSDEDALSALRALDLGTLHQLAAFNSLGDGSSSPFSPPVYHGGRINRSIPTSSKAALQKLPTRVLSRLEEVVARCTYMDWKHFDAGVVKVLGQLSELSEVDVLEELQLLEATDLSNVEYMPAYLNKRLNNRLWSRRKAQQQPHAQQSRG